MYWRDISYRKPVILAAAAYSIIRVQMRLALIMLSLLSVCATHEAIQVATSPEKSLVILSPEKFLVYQLHVWSPSVVLHPSLSLLTKAVSKVDPTIE